MNIDEINGELDDLNDQLLDYEVSGESVKYAVEIQDLKNQIAVMELKRQQILNQYVIKAGPHRLYSGGNSKVTAGITVEDPNHDWRSGRQKSWDVNTFTLDSVTGREYYKWHLILTDAEYQALVDQCRALEASDVA